MTDATRGGLHALRRRLRAVEVSLALAAVSLGAAVLIVGWWGGVDTVRRVHPDLVSMKANTAASMMLLGLGVLGHRRSGWVRAAAALAAAAAAAIGLLTLLQYALDTELGIDQLLASDPGDGRTPTPGRMGANSATVYLVEGMALVLLATSRRWGARIAAQVAVLGAGLLPFAALAGYVFDVAEAKGGLASATEMALHTSVGLLALTLSIALATGDVGAVAVLRSPTAGGTLARRALVPGAGVLVLVGVGVRVGGRLFSTPELQLAGFLVGSTVLLAAVILRVATTLDREARRAEEERETRQALELANARLGDFAATVAHDLRDPLTAIRGLIELAQRDLDDEQRAQLLDGALSSAQQMGTFIDGLLAHVRHADPEGPATPVELDGILTDLDLELGPQLDAAEASLVWGPGLGRVLGSAPAVTHVLRNLVANSIRHRDPDRRLRIEIASRRFADGRHEITVTDTGPGIPPGDRVRVFEPGERLDPSSEGFGLGLAAVKRAVEAMGGHIWIDDRPGGPGTAVHVVLRPVPDEWADEPSRSGRRPGDRDSVTD